MNFASGLRIAGALIATVLLAAGCAGGAAVKPGVQPAYPSDAGALTVVGTENFYADVLHQVGGRKVKVYSFLSDPNADPHQYESNAADARAVADARLVIENGLGYDAFMDRLLKASPSSNREVINVQSLVGAQTGSNAHLWYDPAVMPRVASAAAAALQRLDPAHSDLYSAGLAGFNSRQQAVADEVAALKAKYAGAPVAFTEPVAGYLADAIGLSVKSPPEFMKAIEEGNDPPSGAVAEEENLLRNHEVKVLLYNSQTVTKLTAQVKDVAAASQVPVVGVAETEPPGTTFQDWQLAQLKALETALSS